MNNKALLTKMGSIMKMVERIEKDRTNTHSRYKYASEKVIKEVLHQAFVKYGVIMKIDVTNPRLLEHAGKAICTVIDVNYTFYDEESGESLSGTFVGSGNGRDDKGIYAAVTGAIKYILTSTFLIPTGDDPESNFFDRYLQEEEEEAKKFEEAKKKAGAKKKPEAKSKPKPKPEPEPKPESKPEPEPKPEPESEPASEANPLQQVYLTESEIERTESAFKKLGIEMKDIVAHPDVNLPSNKWTQATRRALLNYHIAISDTGISYNADDFRKGVTL